jgi:hypothetical protein
MTIAEKLFTCKIEDALSWEDFRNQQIDMLEGAAKVEVEVANLPRCMLSPVPRTMFDYGGLESTG